MFPLWFESLEMNVSIGCDQKTINGSYKCVHINTRRHCGNQIVPVSRGKYTKIITASSFM